MKYLIILIAVATTFCSSAQPEVIVQPEVVSEEQAVNGIYEFPEEEAEFPGGLEKMSQFIGENIVYPPEALETNITGRVYLTFIISKRGKIQDVKVVRGVHPLLDQAAIDVIEAMPKWKPAKHNGKKVKSIWRIPINFRLD